MEGSPITPRILAPDDDADDGNRRAPTRVRARRGIDYLELIREARLRSERAALREALRAHGERPAPAGGPRERDATGHHARPDDTAPSVTAVFDDAAADTFDDDDDHEANASSGAANARTQAQRLARKRRIEAHVAPFVAALGVEQLRVTQLMRFVATHVADFCSDEAVVENGNWTVTLKLDDALLPGCTLQLSLSRFCLTLRFDAASNSTRQLVSRHAHVLKEQLTNLLVQLDTPRDVSIETA